MASGRPRSALLAFVGLVACGWWASGLEPFSTPATVAVLAAGLVAMVVGRATGGDASPGDTTVRAAAPWIVLGSALAAWQLAAYVQHPRSDHPTLSSLTNTVLDPRPVRALALAAWLLIAGWLARR